MGVARSRLGVVLHDSTGSLWSELPNAPEVLTEGAAGGALAQLSRGGDHGHGVVGRRRKVGEDALAARSTSTSRSSGISRGRIRPAGTKCQSGTKCQPLVRPPKSLSFLPSPSQQPRPPPTWRGRLPQPRPLRNRRRMRPPVEAHQRPRPQPQLIEVAVKLVHVSTTCSATEIIELSPSSPQQPHPSPRGHSSGLGVTIRPHSMAGLQARGWVLARVEPPQPGPLGSLYNTPGTASSALSSSPPPSSATCSSSRSKVEAPPPATP